MVHPPVLPPSHALPADAAADILVSSGLRDAGYDTVFVTCAGWERDPATQKLRENKVVWPRGCEDTWTSTCFITCGKKTESIFLIPEQEGNRLQYTRAWNGGFPWGRTC